MKPVVALDLDELLFPFLAHFSRFANDRFSKALTVDDYHVYEFEKLLGISREQSVATVNDFINTMEQHPEPVVGAVRSVDKLRDHFDLILVTARHDELKDKTLSWLEAHFPDVFCEIHLCNLFTPGRTSMRTKVDVVIGADAIALVDDSLAYVTDVAASGRQGILFGNFAWNQADELPDNVTRALDWDDVTRQLLEVAR